MNTAVEQPLSNLTQSEPEMEPPSGILPDIYLEPGRSTHGV